MSQANQIKTAMLFRVRITLNKDEPKIAYVPLEKFNVGSASNLPVVIKDKSIEGQHLAVSCVENQIWLTDQNSVHGTRVNGHTIAANNPYRYCPGDKITLGNSEYILQIHMFAQSRDGELEAPRILNDAMERARTKANEILRDAQKEAEKRGEEWAVDSRDKVIKMAEMEAVAIQDRAENIGKAIVSETHHKLLHQKKETELEMQDILFEAREMAAGILTDAEKQARVYLEAAGKKGQMVVRDGRQDVDALMQRAQSASLEIKTAADYQARKIIEEAKNFETDVRKSALDTAELHMQKIMAEALELRKKAEDDVTELYKSAGAQTLQRAEAVRMETEKMIADAQIQAQRYVAAARAEGDHILDESREEGFNIEREAQETAHERSHDAFQAVVAEAESRALAMIQDREQAAQKIHDHALKESLEILAAAREQSARILQEAKLNASLERSADVARALSEAATAAELIKDQARNEVKVMMEAARVHDIEVRAKLEREMTALYESCHQKSEAMMIQRQQEAFEIVTAARTQAEDLKEKTHAENTKLVGQARQVVFDIQEKARRQSEKETEEQRIRTANEVFQMKEQTQETYRLAKIFEADQRTQISREVTEKRAELENELKKHRLAELNRIDMHWSTKRRQDIDILMKNIELGLPRLYLSAEQGTMFLKDIRATIEQSFAMRSQMTVPPVKQSKLAEWSASFIALAFFAVGVPLIYSSVTSVTSGARSKEAAVRKLQAARLPASVDGLEKLMSNPACSTDGSVPATDMSEVGQVYKVVE